MRDHETFVLKHSGRFPRGSLYGLGEPVEAVRVSIYSIIYGCRISAADETTGSLTALATHLVAPMCAVLGIPPPPIPRLPEDPSAPRAQVSAARTKSPGNLGKVPMLHHFFSTLQGPLSINPANSFSTPPPVGPLPQIQKIAGSAPRRR